MSTQTVEIVGQGWQLVYDAATQGPFTGEVRVVTSDAVEFRTGLIEPLPENIGVFWTGFIVGLSQSLGEKLYARSIDGQALLVLDGAIGPPALGLPLNLFTDGGDGPNRRIRVDVAQTGFFAGREFRTFKEFASATTATYVVKISVPINTILFEFSVQPEAGTVRIETIVPGAGITEGGTFSETLPTISTNGMTEKPQPEYVSQVSMTAGGTLTGTATPGTTLRDVSRVKAADNGNFSSTVGGEGGSERGVPPATYYWRFTMVGFIGVIKARWEERP